MYEHPGRLFVEKFGRVEGPEDVKRYAAFLREEAGINHELPIDLSRIYHRFDIPTPKRASLVGQQGLLVNSELGIILIEERDRETRQRFTEAHELMELLFAAMPVHRDSAVRGVGRFKHSAKERLCNEGAAELIMPEDSFLPRVNRFGISYETGRILAGKYDVSISAALVRMARPGPGRHAVILWKMKNKPTEIRNQVPSNQLSLLEDPPERIAPKKLRVEWSFAGRGISYIPSDKSVPEDSSIYAAWRDGCFTTGTDRFRLGSTDGTFRCENLPFEVNDDRQVLSLLHFPGDIECPVYSQ